MPVAKNSTDSSVQPRELGQVLMLLARDFQRRLDTDLQARGVVGVGSVQDKVRSHGPPWWGLFLGPPRRVGD